MSQFVVIIASILIFFNSFISCAILSLFTKSVFSKIRFEISYLIGEYLLFASAWKFFLLSSNKLFSHHISLKSSPISLATSGIDEFAFDL